MVALDTLVVSTALSTIRLELHASIAALEWTVNAYNLSFAVLLMTGAALGDRFGRRRIFASGVALFTLASAACALAPDVGTLIAARAVQGAGAAMVMPLGLTLISTAFPPERRGRAIGTYFAVTGLAVASGPVVGGAITQGLAWQWIFWVNVPLGIALIPLVLRQMRESHGPDGAIDIGGLALVSLGAFGVVWGLVRGNLAGWGSAEVVGALALGLIAFIGVRALGAARRRPDAADALLPLARVHRGQRLDLLLARVAVRRGVLPLAVPAGRARLRPARRRAAAAAVDGHAVLRRPRRGRAGRSLRRAPVHGARADAAGRSAWAGSR